MASIINATTSSGVAVSGDTSGVLQLATNGGTTAVTIDTSQNVGIGQTSPSTFSGNAATNLVIGNGGGSNGITLYPGATGQGTIDFASSTSGTGQYKGYLTYSTTTDTMYLGTAASTRMTISSVGNVGIGTSNPQTCLDVVSGTNGANSWAWFHSNTGGATPNANINSGIMLGGNYSAGNSESNIMWGTGYNAATQYLSFSTWNQSVVSEKMRITSGGGVLIGRTDNPNSLTGAFLYAQGVYDNTTGSAANVFVNSNGALVRSTSSLKYKTDVQDATHGLEDLLKLRSVTYKGKNTETDGQTVFGGLIAEEVDAAGLTEFVQYAEDGTPDALAYGNMVSLCVKAIQEQQALITTLQTQVAELKQKVGA